MFESVKAAQPNVVKMLENSIARDRLAHAIIFEGDKGTGKKQTALFFAARLLCENASEAPCGSCTHCRRIINETHPNVRHISPAKQQILKDSIKALQYDFERTAVENGPKVYIIDQADTMNHYAANALLKFLEEPHPDIFGVLLTTNKQNLLSTIRSRSQILRFTSVPKNALINTLEQEGYDIELTPIAAALTNTFDAAKTLLEDEQFKPFIDAVCDLYSDATQNQSLVLSFAKITEDLLQKNDDYVRLLDLMIHYQKDVIYGKMKHYEKLVFRAHSETIAKIAAMKSLAMLKEELDMMLTLRTRLSRYINERLAFDNLMVTMERRLDHEA